MENWKDMLHDHLKEELSDSIHYAEMAREHDGVTRQMYHDMAEEEYEHACAVWHMMEHHGMTTGMNKDAVFHDAKAALYK